MISIPAAGREGVQPPGGMQMLTDTFPHSLCCCLLPGKKGMLSSVHGWQHHSVSCNMNPVALPRITPGLKTGRELPRIWVWKQRKLFQEPVRWQFPILSCAFHIYLCALPSSNLHNGRLDLDFWLWEFPVLLCPERLKCVAACPGGLLGFLFVKGRAVLGLFRGKKGWCLLWW